MPTRKRFKALPLALLLATTALSAQQRVTINVHVSNPLGRFDPVWAWLGHDEPNYTYSEEGSNLLTKLSQLGNFPVHDRTHNLLTSGDGTPALKWGSTNVFTRDASGKPVYDWTITDKIFDAYKATRITPFVEIGFMPEALSTHPQPYQHHWPVDFATGWSYPPKDYAEWSELVYRWVRHLVERYGAAEVATWEWEVWNEPDIFYWHGTADEYDELYDHTVDAVRRALPRARVGGPASTGPNSQKAAAFLRQFLEHCATGQNYVTGKKGAPLDFISFHAKGKAALVEGHAQLDIRANLKDINQGFAIIEQFPALRDLPVVLSESDPESCAACVATSHPENAYRFTSQYATYEAELLNDTLALAAQHHIHLEGTITWAFTFPGQPIFAGFRAFATHDIGLPLLNAFRMFGQMNGERLLAESTGALPLNDVLQASVRAQPDVDVNAIATRDNQKLNVLVWNYDDNATGAPAAEVHLVLEGLPQGISRALLQHWRIDHDHGNAYSAWQSMGSPSFPSTAQDQQLKAAAQLQLLEPPRSVSVSQNAIELTFPEPSQGMSLLTFTW